MSKQESKHRLYDIARELNISNKDLMDRLSSLDIAAKSHSSTITEVEYIKVVSTIKKDSPKESASKESLNKNTNRWENGRENDYDIERMFKAMSWTNQHGKERVLAFNLKIPLVDKNIDLCLFESGANEYDQKAAVSAPGKIVMLGELKGGIDPAGADEHWKTGNSALNRIRDAFTKSNIKTETSFIAAAIEKNMAGEIFEQLRTGKLSYAANLTIGEQLTNYCNWLLQL